VKPEELGLHRRILDRAGWTVSYRDALVGDRAIVCAGDLASGPWWPIATFGRKQETTRA